MVASRFHSSFCLLKETWLHFYVWYCSVMNRPAVVVSETFSHATSVDKAVSTSAVSASIITFNFYWKPEPLIRETFLLLFVFAVFWLSSTTWNSVHCSFLLLKFYSLICQVCFLTHDLYPSTPPPPLLNVSAQCRFIIADINNFWKN